MYKNYSNWILIVIFFAALLLRWLYLPQMAISFAYDQARDAFVVQEMLSGNLKILGPPVSGVPGLFHGVLYYYIIAPAYYLGAGNPVVVAYFLSFLSSLGVFAVYLLTKLLVKNKVPALLAALVFTFSFESTQYASLMTNASMGAWFIPIFYIGLYLWLTHSTLSARSVQAKINNSAPIITGMALGLSVQSEMALGYHFFPLVAWLVIFRTKIKVKDLLIFLTSLFVSLMTMVVAEIKFGFTGTHGIIYLLSRQDGIVQSKNIIDYITTIVDQSGKTFAYSLYPQNIALGGLIGFGMVILGLFLNSKIIKKKILTWETFLVSAIFSYAVALPFGGWNMRHILVGVAPLVAVFTGIFIWRYLLGSKVILTIVITAVLFFNLQMILKENPKGQTIFPHQLDLTLRNEKAVIDFTYKQAEGEPFSISSVTNPLFVNTLWSYMYNWYGKSTYKYVPGWIGRDQVGQMGNNLEIPKSNVSKHFFIIEPTYGIPDLYLGYARGDQEAISTLVGESHFGEITVQERTRKDEK